MFKRSLLLLVLLLCFKIYSQDKKDNTFLIEFVTKPKIENREVILGASINYNRDFLDAFYLGAAVRLLQLDYSSLYGVAGKEFLLTDTLILPIEAGFGVEIKSLDLLTKDSDELDLNQFIHGLTGIEWIIDNSWNYYLHIMYNYSLQNSETHRVLASIGAKYRF